MKKIAYGIFCIAAIVLVFWNPSGSQPPEDGKAHIRYWYMVGIEDDVPYTVHKFNEIQDSIVVHATPIPWQEHEKKILTAVLSGNPPDVVSQFVPVVRWASRMALRPLDDFVTTSKFDTTIFFPALWDEVTWRGRPYALPLNTASYAFFYNKDLFEEAGLDPEQPPRTWADVRNYAHQLLKIDTDGDILQAGFLPSFSGGHQGLLGNMSIAALIAWQKGVDYLPDKRSQLSMNTPELIEGIRWTINYYSEYDLNAVNAFIGGLGTGEQHGFVTSKLAMMILDMSFLDLIAQYRPEMNFGVTEIPSFEGDPTVSVAGSWWLGIPRGAQHPEAAWDFLQFSVQKDTQLEEIASRNDPLFPANIHAAYDSSFISKPLVDVFVRQMNFAHSPTVVPLAHGVFWREFYGALERSVQGEQNPEDALLQAEITVQSALDRAVNYDEYVRSRMTDMD